MSHAAAHSEQQKKKKKKSNREEEERKSDNDNEAFKLFDFLFGPRTKTTEKNSNPGI